jgi:hypothetical protein
MATSAQAIYSKLHYYNKQLDSMLDTISQLEESLSICMDAESKKQFAQDISTLKVIGTMRIQSSKSKYYITYIGLFGKIENYMYFLKSEERKNKMD